MANRQLDEERIFHVARDIARQQSRDEYLDQICAGDQALRARVEALLEVHENEQAFLKSDPDAAPTLEHTPLAEHPGTTIGRYKLMEQIGEGGMGTVFVAEQERPIRRKVALKVIKPGMDSKAVVARFEAERQALALMDHANIAKVLDAGTTDSGRPYFAMELVRGIPITDYCDEHKLTIRERLELFTQVCQAIQHAHQKAIIHRDIKPTNVLVTEQDGKAVPKVIDFGVAKALNQRLTDQTIYTSFAQVVGTPLYMSPEQAALSALDVDTRSDVYSLGVLLYELLTGTTPFDKRQFEEAAYDEVRRIIREEEPPKPSTRISSLAANATTVNEDRKADLHGLHKVILGDLDWIVMTALEKQRSRRYDSASRFAEDIQRYLDNEIVEARPPSIWYRAQKFYQRNRPLVTSVSVAILALIVGLTWALWTGAKLAQRNEQIAETLSTLRDQLEDKALQIAMSGDEALVEDAIANARETGSTESWAMLVRGLAAFGAGRIDGANVLLNDALEKVRQSDDYYDAIQCAAAVTIMFSGRVDELPVLGYSFADTRTPESHLFKAQLGWFTEDKDTLDRHLQEYFKLRGDTAVGRVVRSFVNTRLAMEANDARRAERAVADALVASELMPTSELALSAKIYANHHAYLLKSHDGDESALFYRKRAIDAANRLFRSDRRRMPMSNAFAAWFFDRIDESENAERHWKRIDDENLCSFFRAAYAQFLFRQGRRDEALALLATEEEDDWLLQPRAVIRCGSEESRSAALRDLRQLLQGRMEMTRLRAFAILYALGEPVTEDMLIAGPPAELPVPLFKQDVIALFDGRLSRNEFELRPGANSSITTEFVALSLYANGHGEDAIALLEARANVEREPLAYDSLMTLAISMKGWPRDQVRQTED